MIELKMVVPDEILIALKWTPATAATEILLAAAVKLYELGRLSSGAAATLAGIPRTLFLARLTEFGVHTFVLSEQELQRDFGQA